ncbi:MAG TPA: hypothetical protein DCG77_17395 [Sphingobacterium sp.]|nr:hypothetical protein [Sphingobacterium sp.]
MENINYNDELKKIFKDCISPYLKNQGFKKNGKTFYKENSEFIYVLNVQYGCSNSKKFSYFTYNIKISSPSFYEKFDINYEKKYFKDDATRWCYLWSEPSSSINHC